MWKGICCWECIVEQKSKNGSFAQLHMLFTGNINVITSSVLNVQLITERLKYRDVLFERINIAVKQMILTANSFHVFDDIGSFFKFAFKKRVRDSMCHLASSLDCLPNMLGFNGDWKKGGFPHKFNIPDYQTYIDWYLA